MAYIYFYVFSLIVLMLLSLISYVVFIRTEIQYITKKQLWSSFAHLVIYSPILATFVMYFVFFAGGEYHNRGIVVGTILTTSIVLISFLGVHVLNMTVFIKELKEQFQYVTIKLFIMLPIIGAFYCYFLFRLIE